MHGPYCADLPSLTHLLLVFGWHRHLPSGLFTHMNTVTDSQLVHIF